MAAATLALPIILTIAAPHARAAASTQTFACVTNVDCSALELNFGCIVGFCKNNICTTQNAVNGKLCPNGGTGNLIGQCLNGACIFPLGAIPR